MQRCVVTYLLLVGSTVAQTSAPSSPQPNPPKPAAATTEPEKLQPQKIDSAKEADIRKLMDLAGTRALIDQMMNSTVQNIKPLMTNALPPGDYREKLVNLFFEKFRSKAETQKLLDIAVVVYDKYYTREEIRGLIEFYGTPLGQKTISVIPHLMADLQEAGGKWGEVLGRDSMAEVLAEHPELEKALEAAKRATEPQ